VSFEAIGKLHVTYTVLLMKCLRNFLSLDMDILCIRSIKSKIYFLYFLIKTFIELLFFLLTTIKIHKYQPDFRYHVYFSFMKCLFCIWTHYCNFTAVAANKHIISRVCIIDRELAANEKRKKCFR
jgi:hypothetical protein